MTAAFAMAALLVSLAAAPQAEPGPPPETHPGYAVACRFQDPAGQVSTVRGRTGTGNRQMSVLAGGRRSFGYEFPDARFEDGATGFSGPPRIAVQTRGGDIVIAYDGHGGAHIQIYAAGTGRPGQNAIARRGRYDRDSHGTCTLAPEAGAADAAAAGDAARAGGPVLAAAMLAAIPAETPPPESWAGPGFACRMAHPSGGAFTLTGAFGAGRRFASATADGRPGWGYVFGEARIADSEILFSGRAMEARTGVVGPHAAPARFELRIAYPRTGGGMELIILEGGAGRRPARLVGYRHEEPVASGTCTLGAGAENRS